MWQLVAHNMGHVELDLWTKTIHQYLMIQREAVPSFLVQWRRTETKAVVPVVQLIPENETTLYWKDIKNPKAWNL